MFSVVATPALSESGSHPQPTSQHTYGTRIRSNSVIKAPARLRQPAEAQPAPKRPKNASGTKGKAATPVAPDAPANDLPAFPPEHVHLHSDDATSKVFLAIGRSFMFVVRQELSLPGGAVSVSAPRSRTTVL